MNIAAIIQARTGSTRFKNKTFAELEGKPLLWHIINRIKKAKHIQDIIIATTTNKEDGKIEDFAKENNIKIYRGSENNVLDRFYQAAKKFNVNIIVRITADDPFKDPKVIDKAIEIFLKENYDYVSNTVKPTYPEGIDVEVFSFSSLKKAWNDAEKISEKEHVTPYIWKNPNIFKTYNFEYKEDLSNLRWTIDYKEDYEFAKEVYKRLYKKDKIFYMEEILELLKKEPELSKINQDIVRNEGYQKSLEEDKKQDNNIN
jgi:spore coat polysaccharide biosynthesis protein SpsF (cytidylyltransferase family)